MTVGYCKGSQNNILADGGFTPPEETNPEKELLSKLRP